MSDFECRTCGEGWNGAYTCEHRCTTCGTPVTAIDCETKLARVQQQLATARRDYEVMNKLREGAEDERDEMAAYVERLTDDLHALMDNSDGVAGLHLNGDVAPWSDLTQGGRFETWLLSLGEAPEISLARLIAEKQAGVIEELASHMERSGYADEAAGVRMWARCRKAEESDAQRGREEV